MSIEYQNSMLLKFYTLEPTSRNFTTMKKILLFIFAGVFTVHVYSQNYQTVNSSEVKLFEPDYGTIRGYRIDSVKVEGSDSLLYPSRSTRSLDDISYCYNPHGSSMLGDYVRIVANRTNLFFNQNGDTIRIKTQAQVNDSWKLWSGTDYDIYANVESIIEGNVFGVTDSIKIIRLNAFDSEMNPYPEFQFGNDSLQLSKNYGLLTTFNFYAFPNLNEEYYQLPVKYYSIYGIESQGLGGSNLTTFGVYDFQPGDEIQYEKRNFYYGLGTIYQFADLYTSRQDYLPDSIVYGLEKTMIQFHHNMFTDSLISNTTISTSITIVPNPNLDELPTLPVSTESGGNEAAYAYFSMNDAEFLQKQDQSSSGGGGTTLIENQENGCFEPEIDGGCYQGQVHTFYKGLGGPYYTCTSDVATINSLQLIYFQKDSIEWGTPFDKTVSVEEHVQETVFEIFPNPATDNLNIKVTKNPQSIDLVIFDVSGREVLSRILNSEGSQLDISGLQSGVYFVRLTVSGNVEVQKIVVE